MISKAAKLLAVCFGSAVLAYYLVYGFLTLRGGSALALTSAPVFISTTGMLTILGLVATAARRVILVGLICAIIIYLAFAGLTPWWSASLVERRDGIAFQMNFPLIYCLVLHQVLKIAYRAESSGSRSFLKDL